MVICLEQGADLHTAQLMPLPLTVSRFSKIQIGFTFLVAAYPGSPGQRAIKRVCMCSVSEAGKCKKLTVGCYATAARHSSLADVEMSRHLQLSFVAAAELLIQETRRAVPNGHATRTPWWIPLINTLDDLVLISNKSGP